MQLRPAADAKIILLGWDNGVFNAGQHAHGKKGCRTELFFSSRGDWRPGKVMQVAQRYQARL
jgi:hypothetical protein